jgi:hypothetical protein
LRTLYALAVATLIALPLPNAPAMAQAAGLNKTAQACAADYLKVVDNLNACFQTIRTRGDLNAHEAAEEKNTLAAKLAAGQTLTPLEIFQLWKHQLDWGGCYISDTAGNCDPTFGDVDRYREAAASYCMDSALKALSRLAQSCSKGAPTLFAGGGASCQWSGSISTSCHSACGGDMQCNYCDQFDASRANLCSPMEDRGTHKVKLSPQLCPQASRSNVPARKDSTRAIVPPTARPRLTDCLKPATSRGTATRRRESKNLIQPPTDLLEM